VRAQLDVGPGHGVRALGGVPLRVDEVTDAQAPSAEQYASNWYRSALGKPMRKMRSHSGSSRPSCTSSSIVPPVSKLGFTDNHGAGHCAPSSSSAATWSRMRWSRTDTKPDV
jgi:hypothetical protein